MVKNYKYDEHQTTELIRKEKYKKIEILTTAPHDELVRTKTTTYKLFKFMKFEEIKSARK